MLRKNLPAALLFLAALSLSACAPLGGGLPSTPTLAATLTAPPATSAPATPLAPTLTPPAATPEASASLATYRDAAAGFELDYPADWVIENAGQPGATVILWSEPMAGPGGDGIPPGVAKIEITVMPPTGQTLDQLVALQKEGLLAANGRVLEESRSATAGGLEIARLRTAAFGEALTLITLINARPVYVTGFGDLSRFEAVAGSLRAVAPSGEAPAFGCSVAYADGARLYCLGDGNTPRLIAESGDGQIGAPAISSDGQWVAFLTYQPDFTARLWAVNVAGRFGLEPLRYLAGPDELGNGDPSVLNSVNAFQWRPGTSRLYFNTRFQLAGGNQGPGEYTNGDLWTVDAETGVITNVLARQSVGDFYFSPDGRQIAVSNPQSIALMNADGSGLRGLLEFPAINTASESAYKPELQWSADSAAFFASVPSADPGAADARAVFYRFGADGAVQALAEVPGNFVWNPSPVRFSPDGRRAAYALFDQAAQTWNLSARNLDGSGVIEVASAPLVVGLAWSPDAMRFAYRFADGQGGTLATLGGAGQTFGEGLTVISLAWANNDTVYFVAAQDNQWGLYTQHLGEAAGLIAPLRDASPNTLAVRH